jgi:hypothetical protein
MSDGMVVDTDNANKHWDENTRWNGNNHISVATGSQWEHQILYMSRRGRFYIERTSQWQGSTPSAEWVSNEEAARWLLANEHEIPDNLKVVAEAVSE